MAFEELVAEGWKRHDSAPRLVHDMLERAIDQVRNDDQLRAFSRLMTHLHAEHIDDRTAAWRVLRVLRAKFEGASPSTYRAATTSIEVLRFLDGDTAGISDLSHEERAAVLATSASALAWHKQLDSAVAAYDRALDEASAGLPDNSPALRALAAAGNNLAVTLEQTEARSASDTAAMMRFADAALVYWKRAGGWLEQQRAHYRCAQSRLEAKHPTEAIVCAAHCFQLCEQNGAPAYERFFACAASALAHQAAGEVALFDQWRAAAQVHFEALSSDERIACKEEFAKLHMT